MTHARVLLVDDEVALAQALARRLSIRKYRATAVFNAEDALDAVGLDAPDVMVIDLHLPGMLGIDLVRAVKQLDPTIAMILLSGCGSPDAERWIGNGDILDFVMKPIEIEELVQKIDRAKKEHDARLKMKESGHG